LRPQSDRGELYAVDLFAGGGGLTQGLKNAGFRVVGSVELEPHAFATYKANHPEVHALKQDIRTVRGASLLGLSPTRRIDLLAGCPPCQGFSSLTAKYDREDPRNFLINEMGRLVKETSPRCVMLENVPGLGQRGDTLFQNFIETLKNEEYQISYSTLQVADYGVPQNRRRLVLLAGKGFKITLPPSTHAKDGKLGLKPWVTVREALRRMPEPLTLEEANKRGGPMAFDWHVVRTLSHENRQRMKAAKPGESWRKIPKRLRPQCHQDKEVGFGNVYGRMAWNQIAPTMTGGCTTFSKGRFGHPEEERTISVREAALLQTFPPSYVIDTQYMEHACNIIGNALPCRFAEALAARCKDTLLKNEEVA